MNDPKTRRTPLPNGGYLILRGYVPDDQLAIDAATAFLHKYPGWGLCGVSGFYAADGDAAAVIYQTKLVRWEDVQLFHIEDITSAGLDVQPTFRTPHVTITHIDAHQLIHRLTTCPHELIKNPYYGNRTTTEGTTDDGTQQH